MIHKRAKIVVVSLLATQFSGGLQFYKSVMSLNLIHFLWPDFLTITILAPCLVFLGSLLSDFSRELGQLFPGLVSGVMFVLSVLYCFEPAIMGLMGDIETGDAVWKTFRLVVLSATVLFAAKLLINAWLLVWVKEFMEKNPTIDYSINGEDLISENTMILETEA